MRALFLALVALAVAAPAALQAGGRALTIADLYDIRDVVDPLYSPDGERVAFTVVSHDLVKGTSNSEIYLMNADGSGLRRMTRHDGADYHPRWSPDGAWLLFVSTRRNGAQVWRMPVDGGEAEPLTDFSMGVNEPIWTADGKHVVFFTEVFPECGADSACNEKLAKDMDDGVVQAHLADDLLYRHWTFWKDGKRFHTLIYDLEAQTYLDLTPGNLDFPYFMTGGANAGLAVSPDGAEVCAATNADPNHWETTNKDLYVAPTAGGPLKNITDDNEAFDGQPAYSPDGRYIAYLTMRIPSFESDLARLALYDRETGKKKTLTNGFDYWVHSLHWASDSKSIFFTAEYQGVNPLYRIDIQSGKLDELLDFRSIDAFDISPDDGHVVVGRRSIGEPREIWSATTDGRRKTRLTAFNKPVEDEVDIRPAEELWIDSPTGRKIHTWVVKPHGFDPEKKYPFILNVHGGPQGMWWDSFRGDWQVYPGAGYVIAFPNPHGSSGYGQDFTHAISGDWQGKVYADVMAVTEHMAAQPWVDEGRMGAMGWSYGGYMMMWMAGHTDRFKAIASMMGLYDLPAMWGATEELWFPQYDLGGAPWESKNYVEHSPHNSADDFKTPSLVITGERDYRVPYTQSLEFFSALQKKGVPSRLIVFENDGHWPSWVKSMPLYYNAHLEWFHEYLGGDPAPWSSRDMVRNRAFEKSE